MIKKKRCITVLAVCFFLFLNTISAEEKPANILLTLKDINNNEDIDSVVVTVNDDFTINQFVEEGEILRINLGSGQYNAEFKVDSQVTDGKDYYGKDVLNVETNLIKGIFLYPVGSIRGIVKDKLDNIVGNAKLKFECSGADMIDFPETSDEFGSFSIDYMPVGNCKILANYKEGVGFTNIIIEKGSLNDIEIKLDKSIVPKEQTYLWFIIIGLVIILVVVGVIFREDIKSLTKREKKLEKIEKKEEEEIKELKAELKLPKRARDVMETLKEKEKEIVEFIVQEKGKTTQSKVYNETGIPKASLFRYMQSLEHKKIVEVKKIGKMKKIKLTGWFLGKEKTEQK